jgi:hypothetical protein
LKSRKKRKGGVKAKERERKGKEESINERKRGTRGEKELKILNEPLKSEQ